MVRAMKRKRDSVSKGHNAVVRRRSIPSVVKKIWKSIIHLRKTNKPCKIDALVGLVDKSCNLNATSISEQIELAVKDGLVLKREDGTYHIPCDGPETEKVHDWYCFVCHTGGEVIPCSTCWRVYHRACVVHSEEICQSCRQLAASPEVIRGREPTIAEMKRILTIVHNRIFQETPALLHQLIFDNAADSRSGTSRDPFSFLAKKLLYKYDVNFSEINRKIRCEEYSRYIEFEIDCRTILHNIILVYGPKTAVAEMAVKMHRTCREEYRFLRDCINCYLSFYNADAGDNWFTELCNPPHELVYAKVRGFPNWPAKVIKKESDQYFVWFFGAKHERGIVRDNNVLPSCAELPQPKFKPLVNALEELERHRKLLNEATRAQPECSFRTNGVDSDVPDSACEPAAQPKALEKSVNLTRKRATSKDPLVTKEDSDNDQLCTPSELTEGCSRMNLPPKKRLTVVLNRQYVTAANPCDTQNSEDLNTANSPDSHDERSNTPLLTGQAIGDSDDQPLRRSTRRRNSVRRLIEEVADATDQTDGEGEGDKERERGRGRGRRVKTPGKTPSRTRSRSTHGNEGDTPSAVRNLSEAFDKKPYIVEQSLARSLTAGSVNGLDQVCQDTSSREESTPFSRSANLKSRITQKKSASCTNLRSHSNPVEETEIINCCNPPEVHIKQEVLDSEDDVNVDETSRQVSVTQSTASNGLPSTSSCQKCSEYESELQAMREYVDSLNAQVEDKLAEAKRKLWCCCCLKEAIYYCCWNVAYCSTECQDKHWRASHKSSCKRNQRSSCP